MRAAILALVAPLLLAGCVVTTSERESLPRGVTLLDTDEGVCEGPIEIEAEPDLVIEEGEDVTLAVSDDEDEIEWHCLSESEYATEHEGETDCPDGTSHLQISRDPDDAEFTLECYGV